MISIVKKGYSTMTTSSIKLGNFNSLEREEVIKFLKESHLDEVFEVADAKRTYWQNAIDTLVLKVNRNSRSLTFHDGVNLGELTRKFNAEEFDNISEDYESYYRIWWD
jgi:hypothetical protein